MSKVAPQTLEIVRQLSPAPSIEASLRQILASEIRRRLNRYELIDRHFRRKYGMDFKEFRERHVVKEKGYTFEVESDYCDWEMAVTSVDALRKQLAQIESEDAQDS